MLNQDGLHVSHRVRVAWQFGVQGKARVNLPYADNLRQCVNKVL